jgi:hypothetical protein
VRSECADGLVGFGLLLSQTHLGVHQPHALAGYAINNKAAYHTQTPCDASYAIPDGAENGDYSTWTASCSWPTR